MGLDGSGLEHLRLYIEQNCQLNDFCAAENINPGGGFKVSTQVDVNKTENVLRDILNDFDSF